MLHTPVSETKTETAQGKSQLAPQFPRELHPHSFGVAGAYSLASASFPQVQQRHTLAGMQAAHGNQAVLHALQSPQRVARMPALHPSQSIALQRKCACGGSSESAGECAECKAKREADLQRRVANQTASPAAANSVPPIVHNVLNSPGQPLDAGTRTFMEPRFGHDFSQVRVHTDARAAKSAQAVNALAYTVGRNVVFGAGQHQPETSEGRRLMAHELTHVVQQQSSNTSSPITGVGYLEQAEWEAEQNVQAIEIGGSPVARHHAPALMRMSLKSVSCKSADKDNLVKAAFDYANQWLPKAIELLDRYLKTENPVGGEAEHVNSALDQNFFHPDYQPGLSPQQKHAKGEQILEVLKRMRDGTISVECDPETQEDCRRDATAHSLAGVYVIHACPKFFDPRPDEQGAGSIIHEMAHIVGASKLDLAYSHQRKYPVLTIDEALKNAESYALFVQQLGTPGFTFPGSIPRDKFDGCAGLETIIEKALAEAELRLQIVSTYGPPIEVPRLAKGVYEKLHGSAFTIQCMPLECQPQSYVYLSKRGSLINICPPWKSLTLSEEQVEHIISALFQEFAGLKSKPNQAFKDAEYVYQYFDKSYLYGREQGSGSTPQPELQKQPEKKGPTPSKESNPAPGEPASPEKAGPITLTIRGIRVVLEPEIEGQLEDKSLAAETHVDLHIDNLIQPDQDAGKVTDFISPSFTMVLQTVYKPGVRPDQPSGYGIGTRPEDIGERKTLGYHEQSHFLDAIEYLRNHPAPRFEGKKGMTVKDFYAAYDDFKKKVAQYNEALLKFSALKTHCVGITIDEYHRTHGIKSVIQCGKP